MKNRIERTFFGYGPAWFRIDRWSSALMAEYNTETSVAKNGLHRTAGDFQYWFPRNEIEVKQIRDVEEDKNTSGEILSSTKRWYFTFTLKLFDVLNDNKQLNNLYNNLSTITGQVGMGHSLLGTIINMEAEPRVEYFYFAVRALNVMPINEDSEHNPDSGQVNYFIVKLNGANPLNIVPIYEDNHLIGQYLEVNLISIPYKNKVNVKFVLDGNWSLGAYSPVTIPNWVSYYTTKTSVAPDIGISVEEDEIVMT